MSRTRTTNVCCLWKISMMMMMKVMMMMTLILRRIMKYKVDVFVCPDEYCDLFYYIKMADDDVPVEPLSTEAGFY